MKKFYAILAAATVAAASVQAAPTPVKKVDMSVKTQQTNATVRLSGKELVKNQQAVAKARAKAARKAPVAKLPGAPDGLEVVYDFPDQDNVKVGSKTGVYYSYNWLFGSSSGTYETAISRYQRVGDKFYMSDPFYAVATNGILVGDIQDNVVTFTFPQYINHEEDEDYLGNPYAIDYYANLVKFELSDDPDEAAEGYGWFNVCEQQQLQYTLNEDGSLTYLGVVGDDSADGGDYLIGCCEWVTTEEVYDEELDEYVDVEVDPYWYWNGNGDYILSLNEFTDVAVTAPENLDWEDWTLYTSEYFGRKIKIGFDGNDVYVRGLFNYEGGEDFTIKGVVDGDMVKFESGQYMGIYWGNMTPVYMLAGKYENDPDWAEIIPSLDFAYDKEKNVMQSADVMFLSSIKNRIYYYTRYMQPKFGNVKPEGAIELINPVRGDEFYMPEEGWSGDFNFIFPNIDKNDVMLDTSKLFYNVFVDGELFTVYGDEYTNDFENEDDEMTDIPYLWNGYDIYYSGDYHYFYFYFEGFDRIDIQTLYKDGEDVVKSDMVNIYPGDDDAVDTIAGEKNVKSVKYFDMLGNCVNRPTDGIFVRVSTLEDGTRIADKVIRK